jgi:hypothetical protein
VEHLEAIIQDLLRHLNGGDPGDEDGDNNDDGGEPNGEPDGEPEDTRC